MERLFITVGFALLGYLFGSLPFSIWITQWVKGVDVRLAGSRHASTPRIRSDKQVGDLVSLCFFLILVRIYSNISCSPLHFFRVGSTDNYRDGSNWSLLAIICTISWWNGAGLCWWRNAGGFTRGFLNRLRSFNNISVNNSSCCPGQRYYRHITFPRFDVI